MLLFASVVLCGLTFIWEASFTARSLAIGTAALAVVTYLFVLRERPRCTEAEFSWAQ